METSRKSPTARLLAVAALAVAVAALILIVSTAGGGSSSGGGSTTPKKVAPKVLNGTKLGLFWTVKSGQTLTTIAHMTGVSVARIQTLNPNVDPQALNAGQRIRIKRR